MQKYFINKIMFVLSLAATIALLFNMISIPLFKHDVFDKSVSFAVIEYILFVCFLIIFMFNAFCFIWGCRQSKSKTDSIFSTFVLLASVLCIIMMFGEKTMIDEIAREYQLNWETDGEWIILYLFFLIQLIFNSVVIIKLKTMLKTV